MQKHITALTALKAELAAANSETTPHLGAAIAFIQAAIDSLANQAAIEAKPADAPEKL